MDYPVSDPTVGLVGGKFSDGDPVGGVAPSRDPAAWANAVTDELLAIIAAAGLTPDEADLNQVLDALRSSGVFLTATQFDTSTKVATMAALQRALGNHSGYKVINADTTLTADDAGKIIVGTGSGNNVTLPVASTLPDGTTFRFAAGSVGFNLASQGSDTISPFLGGVGGSFATYALGAGQGAELVKAGGGYLVVSSTGSASVGSYGYEKKPNGLIYQWGAVTNQPSGSPVSFGTAFPSAVYAVIPISRAVGSGLAQAVWPSSTSLVNWTPLMAAQADISFFAIGK